MKLKTDENIGASGVDLLRKHGHDVATVREQGLGGAADEAIFRACAAERRALITLDRDFGQVARFRPREAAGIVVVALGGRATKRQLHARLRDFLALSATRAVEGELWVVEPGRVRVHLEK